MCPTIGRYMPPMDGQQLELIGFEQVDTLDATTITFTINDGFQHKNLRIEGARGQCYDGGGTRYGDMTGVATSIESDAPNILLLTFLYSKYVIF